MLEAMESDVPDDENYHLREVFDVCDTERCGYISVDHFSQLAADHFGSSSSVEEAISRIIHVLDPDGSGQIQFDQFCEGVRQIMQLQGDAQLETDEQESSTCSGRHDDNDADHHCDSDDDDDDHADITTPREFYQSTTTAYQPTSSVDDDGDSGYPEHHEHGLNGAWPEGVDEQNVEYLSYEESPECSTSDLAPSPAINHNTTLSPASAGNHVTPSSIARQLYRTQNSRRSSLSDTVYDDIDGSFTELNDKVKLLEEKVRELTDSQERSISQQTRMKDENANLVKHVHVLEEQLRDVELRATEQLTEEQRRHHELLARSDKDKTREIEILSLSLQQIEKECSSLKEEVPALRSDNERLRKENTRQSRENEELQQKLTDLLDEHQTLQQYAQNEQFNIAKERTVHSQLLDELTRELDELRVFKAELLAKSPSSQRSDLPRHQRRQLEENIARLKLENVSLREQTEELQAQLLHRHVVEGRALLDSSKSLAAEINSLSTDELKELLCKEQESNSKLREYIERITLRILDKNPSILEV